MNVSTAVHKLCLSLPQATDALSHGMQNYKVAGKTFATYAINHHGDGRVALWLAAAPGAQLLHTETEPEHYFVPQYVGGKGWLGVQLNTGLAWDSIAARVKEAFVEVAPRQLVAAEFEPAHIEEPVEDLAPEEIDPLLRPALRKLVDRIAAICSKLPESHRDRQFGNPVWKAGKKTYVCLHRYDGTLCLQVWVGAEQQSFLVADSRYRIPAYVGKHGWIDLAIEGRQDWPEIESLILGSYRHFALQRMLKQLDGAA